MNVFFLAYYFLGAVLHPIHISKCQIEVNSETKQLEIIVHVFIDDLQATIESQGSPELFLATKSEIGDADKYIFNYLQEHLLVLNDGKQVKLNWIGKEMSDDLLAFWCYLETAPINESKEFTIEYSVLHEYYNDQINILNVIKSDGEEHYYLCKPDDARMEVK